jgi:hypothetical protein
MHASSSVIRVNLSGCLNDWLSVVLRHLPPDNYRLIFHAQNHSLSPTGIPTGHKEHILSHNFHGHGHSHSLSPARIPAWYGGHAPGSCVCSACKSKLVALLRRDILLWSRALKKILT